MHPLDDVWRTGDPGKAGRDLTGMVRRVHANGAQKVSPQPQRKLAAPRQAPGPDFVEALAHGLAVLECWKGTDEWLSNSELADRSGLTRPTVSRLTAVMVNLGYLARDFDRRGRLRLTTSTLSLGFGSALATEVAPAAQAELEKLARELDVYAALSIRRADKVQILENVASPLHPNAVAMDVGALLPICRSTSGLAAMSVLPEQELLPLLERMRSHYGQRWEAIQKHLNMSRIEYSRNGYYASVATLSRHVGAVAIPLVARGSGDVFVLACGMAANDFYPERVNRNIAPRMMESAQILARALPL